MLKEKNTIGKKIISSFVTYVGTLGILILLLFFAVVLPRGNTDANVKTSYQDLMTSSVNTKILIPGMNGSGVDIYADSIWVNMVYYMDPSHPILSILKGRYYEDKEEYDLPHVTQNRAIEEGKPANQTYERYWHGSMIYLKPLFALFSIKGVRVVQYVILTILLGVLIGILLRRKLWRECIAFLVGILSVNLFIVPYGLEFFNAFAITFSLSIYCLISKKKGLDDFFTFFLVAGTLIAFFDFLTVEILSLVVPLFFLLCTRREQVAKQSFGKTLCYLLKCSILWGVGYGVTFLLKWFTASVVLNKDAVTVALSHAKQRMSETISLPLWRQWLQGIRQNLDNLFPVSLVDSIGEMVVFWVLLLFVLSMLFVYRSRRPGEHEKRLAYLLLCLGFVPFLRYSVLINHAYLHSFFTYRCLLITIMAVSYFILIHLRITEKKERRKKRRG